MDDRQRRELNDHGRGKGAEMAEQQQTDGQQSERTFTQEEVNELMGKVRRETRDKFRDYEDLKKKADAYDEAQEESKSELEKAREESARAIDELNALKAEKARSELRQKVSKETGVPASLVNGDDEDSMTANAKAIAEYARTATAMAPKDKGGAARKGGKTNADLFADALSSFK